jgi:secondary thiamine-phosphate synthase enzyme
MESGIVTLFVPHTTAGVTINENADPSVQSDMLRGLAEIAPESQGFYRHAEGNSDSHIKASLVGASEQILVDSGKLVLGTWQGIYFAEFDGPRTRKLQIKLQPDPA